MIEIRLPRVADEVGCRTLAAAVIGEERAGAFIRSHLERHHLIVAEGLGEVVGFLAYRIDWFQCTFVSLVVVRDDFRRKGIARDNLPQGVRELLFYKRIPPSGVRS